MLFSFFKGKMCMDKKLGTPQNFCALNQHRVGDLPRPDKAGTKWIKLDWFTGPKQSTGNKILNLLITTNVRNNDNRPFSWCDRHIYVFPQCIVGWPGTKNFATCWGKHLRLVNVGVFEGCNILFQLIYC